MIWAVYYCPICGEQLPARLTSDGLLNGSSAICQRGHLMDYVAFAPNEWDEAQELLPQRIGKGDGNDESNSYLRNLA